VATARHLFASQGFHQTPMSELASISGVSVGQIYRFFASKNELIREIIREDAVIRIASMDLIAVDLKNGKISVEVALKRLCLQALTTGDEALSFDILAEAHRDASVAETIAEVCIAGRAMIGDFVLAANPEATRSELEGAEEMILALVFGLGHRTLSRPRLTNDEVASSTAFLIYTALHKS